MTDQLISFETAKLLSGKLSNTDSIHIGINKSYNDEGLLCTPPFQGRWKAPTQSLLQKWLREKHNLHIQIHFDAKTKLWETRIFLLKEYINEEHNKVFMQFNQYGTYEEALEQGLYQALLLIKVESSSLGSESHGDPDTY